MVLPTASKNQKIVFCIIFFLCLFIQVIPVIRSGLTSDYGIGFWGSNGHDGVWHLGLINHISNPLKISMSVFAGEALKNYHPIFDILIAFFSKITFISTSIWLFQIFPLISASLFLLLSFILGRKITGKYSGALLLMILNSISNSLGWIVSLIRFGNFNGESLFWAMQSPSHQLNPPFALSILLILLLIYLLQFPRPRKIFIFLILIFLPIIKVYSAIPAFIIFAYYSLKNKSYLKTLFLSIFIAVLLFFQYNSTSASLILFKPLWFANTLIESPDRVFLPKITNMRYALENSGRLGPRLIAIYLGSLLLFLVGNFSWRLIAIKEVFKKPELLWSIIVCTLIPIFFIQKGTNWNTIQFLYYALFLANIPLSNYLTKHSRLIPAIVILNLLPLFGSLPNYLGAIPPAAIPPKEIEALNFLKQQKPGIVLTFPYDKYLRQNISTRPLPLYAYETTSYVAAYSHHFTYLEDEMNLENSSFPWQPRLESIKEYFRQDSPHANRGFIINNQIDYLYLPKNVLSSPDTFAHVDYLEPIFDNSEIIIYRVKR